jgi:hypothetical protein
VNYLKSEEEIRAEKDRLFEQYYRTDSANIEVAHSIVEQRLWVMHWILDGVLKDIEVPEHLTIPDGTLIDMREIQFRKEEQKRGLIKSLKDFFPFF